MKHPRWRAVLCACAAASVGFLQLSANAAPNGAKRGDLGTKVKLRILVDKVMQPEEGWVTKEWMVREAAGAGFNVFSPRKGYSDLDAVRRVTAWCARSGIFHMPWMRGSLAAPPGAEADGKRLVWADGTEQPLWSPNADAFWEWTRRHVVEYARISARDDHLMGVFLDYENYAPGRPANCYDLSYDADILRRFAASRKETLPELPPAGRKKWLEKKGIHQAFAAFQVAHWRARCRELRQAIDRVDPTFQFCIYPAPGTPFMREAAYPEWGTPKAPLILADAITYGRPSRFLPQEEALAANRKRLLERMEIPRTAGIPFLYAGGIDPVVKGADPEFSGKNAVAISERTAGYWVFYEGPKYRTTHREYFQWFHWANEKITEGRLDAWKEPRETPEAGLDDVFDPVSGAILLEPPAAAAKPVSYPPVELRGRNVLILACRSGRSVELTLRHVPVARYTSPLGWEVRDARRVRIDSGRIPRGATGTVSFTPKTDGLYLVGLTAGGCAYTVVRSNVPVGAYAGGDGLSLIHGAKRFFFHVPAAVRRFTVRARGQGAETVRLRVFNPSGKEAASGQTGTRGNEVRLDIAAGGGAGRTWSLQIGRADRGVLEDGAVILGKEIPPCVSFVPEQVFGATRHGK